MELLFPFNYMNLFFDIHKMVPIKTSLGKCYIANDIQKADTCDKKKKSVVFKATCSFFSKNTCRVFQILAELSPWLLADLQDLF